MKDRFEVFVNKISPEDCWEWLGSTSRGRAMFWWNNTTNTAARAAYIIYKGVDPKQLYVCHKCDNKLCVNPEHLFLGTTGDNMADMVAKGRSANKKGEAHHLVKLKEKDVLEIRDSNLTNEELAKQYMVSSSNIRAIIKRKSWKHI